MTAITAYRILEADDAARLSEQVNSLIAEGWQPIGGVVVLQINAVYPATAVPLFRWRYAQAMGRALQERVAQVAFRDTQQVWSSGGAVASGGIP